MELAHKKESDKKSWFSRRVMGGGEKRKLPPKLVRAAMMPPAPAFYSRPAPTAALAGHTAARVPDHPGAGHNLAAGWGEGGA